MAHQCRDDPGPMQFERVQEPFAKHYYHTSIAGSGGSSYIDRVILRDRDHNSGWSSAADGTLEERVYLLQNWRADVVAIILPNGGPQMYYRYDAYGQPIALHAGDIDGDGDVDAADFTEQATMSGFDQRGDFADGFGTSGPDGVVDFGDSLWLLGHVGTYGRGYVASQATAFGGLRKLYAGYELDPHLAGTKYHVRNRLFDAESGRWSRRDPLGYVDGMGLYEYVVGRAVVGSDPSGLGTIPSCPSTKPNPTLIGDGWVTDPGSGHCKLACFRSVTSFWRTTGGNQCCYGKSPGDPNRGPNSLNQDPKCMGTIDFVGVCIGEFPGGGCIPWPNDFRDHILVDYIPYVLDSVSYNEAHCCLRNCGVPSGISQPPGGIDEDSLLIHWNLCKARVATGRKFCGNNKCIGVKPPVRVLFPRNPAIPVSGAFGIGTFRK